VSSNDIFSWANYGVDDLNNPNGPFFGVDVSAPGEGIYSTIFSSQNTGYEAWDGTSMASPVVASCLGLLKAAYPDASNDWLLETIIQSSDPIDDLNPLYAGQIGAGRINIRNALSFTRFPNLSIESFELVTHLAAPERGLEALLENCFSELRSELGKEGGARSLLDEIRSFSQDYRISRERHQMQSAFNSVSTLRQQIQNRFPQAQKDKALAALARWLATAEEILATDVAIRGKFNDFALQEKMIAPISQTLISLAKEDLHRAQSRIARAHGVATGVMAIISFIGLLLSVAIAWLLHSSITQRIVRLSGAAIEVQKGNLQAVFKEESADELGVLSQVFSSMTERLANDIIQLTSAEETLKRSHGQQTVRRLRMRVPKSSARNEETFSAEKKLLRSRTTRSVLPKERSCLFWQTRTTSKQRLART